MERSWQGSVTVRTADQMRETVGESLDSGAGSKRSQGVLVWLVERGTEGTIAEMRIDKEVVGTFNDSPFDDSSRFGVLFTKIK